MKLIFATQNLNKIKEIKQVLDPKIELIGLNHLGVLEEIPELGDTLEENAIGKARYIYDRFKKNTIADDTGLEVQSLNGAPGVHSARYAGLSKNSDNNINKLLVELGSSKNRRAQFRTLIALIINGKQNIFEGKVEGNIIDVKRGHEGFGYDPIFVPDGYQKTFAEMSLEEKNKISHRARAIHKLCTFLQEYGGA